MKKITLTLLLFGIALMGCNINNAKEQASEQQEEAKATKQPLKVQFPSLDGLEITANVYEISKDTPVILLCHQARFNKFEYEGIAQKLNERGFNCVAIDQRSGGPIANMPNETTLKALEQNKPTAYLDAEQDIIAAINYVSKRYNRPVILWGSSYSSTLALYLAVDNENVAAVVAFSPGNYFAEQKGSLVEKLADFEKPMFITSSKEEIPYIEELLQKHRLNEKQVHFEPAGKGYHGSRVLWNHMQGGEEYWKAIDGFLEMIRQ